MRRYNQGWRNDSERHSLAARGVKSKGDISWWKMLFSNDYYKKSMEDMSDILPTLARMGLPMTTKVGTQVLSSVVPDSQTLLALAECKSSGSVSTGVIGSALSMPTESLT